MTKQDEQEFKRVIKEGVLEVLESNDGQEAIVKAMTSDKGKDAIKVGTLAALKSEEGEDIIMNYLVDYFHDVLEPGLDDILYEVKQLKNEVKYMKDGYGPRIDRLERKVSIV